MKTFNEWLVLRESRMHCLWCNAYGYGEYCPSCGYSNEWVPAGDEPEPENRSLTDEEFNLMAKLQKEYDDAEDEFHKIWLQKMATHGSNTHKDPEVIEADKKRTNIYFKMVKTGIYDLWKKRPWDAQQQQRHDINNEFRKLINPHLGEGILDYFNTGRKGKVAREKLVRSIYDDPHYPDYPSPRFGP